MRSHVNYVTFLMVFCLIGAGAPARAGLKSSGVKYQQGETVMHGYIVHDEAIRIKRPGVLVVHEWWGLNDHARAAADALAKAGYVALAVDMYGEGKNTDHPEKAGEWSRFIRENDRLPQSLNDCPNEGGFPAPGRSGKERIGCLTGRRGHGSTRSFL